MFPLRSSFFAVLVTLLFLFSQTPLCAQQAVRLGPVLTQYRNDNSFFFYGAGGALEVETALGRRFSFGVDLHAAAVIGNTANPEAPVTGRLFGARSEARFYPGGAALRGVFVAGGVQFTHVDYEMYYQIRDGNTTITWNGDWGMMLGGNLGLGAVLLAKGPYDLCVRVDAMGNLGDPYFLFNGGVLVGYRF